MNNDLADSLLDELRETAELISGEETIPYHGIHPAALAGYRMAMRTVGAQLQALASRIEKRLNEAEPPVTPAPPVDLAPFISPKPRPGRPHERRIDP